MRVLAVCAKGVLGEGTQRVHDALAQEWDEWVVGVGNVREGETDSQRGGT